MNRYFEINENGQNIRCKIYCHSLSSFRRAVIYCHGFAGHKDNKAAERFADRVLTKYKDVAVITFNLPCHGDDVKKKLSLTDCDTYLSLVTGYICRQYGVQDLFCYASSFGGYLVLLHIARHGNSFRKIVLRCPAVDMYDTLTRVIMQENDMDRILKGRDVQVGFDRKIAVSPAFLNELKENDIRKADFLDYADDILILHGTKDEVVPFASSESFAENNVIEFIPVENADHRFQDPLKMDIAIRNTLDFFAF